MLPTGTVPEKNPREGGDLTPEGGRAKRTAVGAPTSPKKKKIKQANWKSALG